MKHVDFSKVQPKRIEVTRTISQTDVVSETVAVYNYIKPISETYTRNDRMNDFYKKFYNNKTYTDGKEIF